MTAPQELIDTDERLSAVLAGLAGDTGPVAADTERASGYRYVQRAYLIQLKTAATGVHLIDPVGLGPAVLARLDGALAAKEWILHAASQDLPSLRLTGLNPRQVFDTELAARLLGRQRVGLGPLIEDVLGVTLTKEHGNSDWSQRPLPDSWLTYAADDVAFLIELAAALKEELAGAGKLAWAEQEFAHIVAGPPPEPKVDPWRSTTDIHLVHNRRGLAVVQHLWQTRDRIGRELDLAPHRVVPDRAIAAMAARVPGRAGGAAPGLTERDWRRRVAREHIGEFQDALRQALALSEADLPPLKSPQTGLPAPSRWTRTNPEAAKRWQVVRPVVVDLANTKDLPVENLISPKALRTLVWEPAGSDPASVDRQLAQSDVRPWQRELVVPVISEALTRHA